MSVVNSGLRSRYEQTFLPRMQNMPEGPAACNGKHEIFKPLIEGRGNHVARKEAQKICQDCPLKETCPARVKPKAANTPKTPA